MNIGTYKQTADGGYAGTLRLLKVNEKAELVPVAEKSSENSPAFKFLVGKREIGAGWRKTPAEKRPYVSLSFDDLTFPEKVYANLVEGQAGEFDLLWSRRRNDE